LRGEGRERVTKVSNGTFGENSAGGIMRKGFKIGSFELTWLNGGRFELDGGAMFGVVPKVLWQKKYPADEQNNIPLIASPILVKAGNKNILIETGLGN